VPLLLKWSQPSKRRHKARIPRYNSSALLPIRHDSFGKRDGRYGMFNSDGGEGGVSL